AGPARARTETHSPVSRRYQRSPNELQRVPSMNYRAANGRAQPPGAPDGSASRPYQRNTDEFAAGASEWPDDISRREFLRLAGATLAVAGFSSCTKQPAERIVPYVKQPEIVIPGKPLRFATATQYGGFAQGLLVTGYEGRPTKIEGNPTHSASLGATTVWAQADVLDLYDPDRAQTVTTGGAIKTVGDFWDALNLAIEPLKANGGAAFRILSEAISSPTLLAQLDRILQIFPAARWCIWDPLNRDTIGGAEVMCDFSKAKIVVAFDSDFLYAHPYALRYARDFASRRRVIEPHGAAMNRLYAPADFNFADAFNKVKLRVHHSIYFNETSRHAHWHVPATHFLESWSDTRAFDGSISIVQPLIEPMYVGVSAHEILEAIIDRS